MQPAYASMHQDDKRWSLTQVRGDRVTHPSHLTGETKSPCAVGFGCDSSALVCKCNVATELELVPEVERRWQQQHIRKPHSVRDAPPRRHQLSRISRWSIA